MFYLTTHSSHYLQLYGSNIYSTVINRPTWKLSKLRMTPQACVQGNCMMHALPMECVLCVDKQT